MSADTTKALDAAAPTKATLADEARAAAGGAIAAEDGRLTGPLRIRDLLRALADALDAKDAELARLRAELRQIADATPPPAHRCPLPNIARASLETP